MTKTWGVALALLFAGILTFFGGALIILRSLKAIPGEGPFYGLFNGAVLLGIGIGILCLRFRWFDLLSSPMPPRVFWAIGFVLTLFIGKFVKHCGMRQIGGYDYSILIDFGWRLYQGQKPYFDFPCTVPPAFALGAKFAFQWFGVTWHSLTIMTALFSMATFAWSLFLLERLCGAGLSALLWAFTMQVFSMMLASFWWYSSLTSIGAVLYMLSAMYWLRHPDDNIALISYGVSLLLKATLKANVAGIMIPGFTVVFLFSQRHRWKVIVVSMVAFAAFLLLLALNNFSFFGLLNAYLYIAPRGASLVPFLIEHTVGESLRDILEIVSFVLPAVIVISKGRGAPTSIITWFPVVFMVGALLIWIKVGVVQTGWAAAAITLPIVLALAAGRNALNLPGLWIAVISLFGGIYGCLTNSEPELINLPPVAMATILLVYEMRSPSSETSRPFQLPVGWSRYFGFVCVVFCCLGIAQGYFRERVRGVGYGRFFQYTSLHVFESGFFEGVHSGENLDEAVKLVGNYLNHNPAATVWFGERMEWAYAAFKKPSPIGEPVVWDRLTMFDESREETYFEHLLRSRNTALFLWADDPFNFLGNEEGRLLDEYEMDRSSPYVTILRLKK